jgi:Tfp pilus assembly protein PilO
LNAVGVLGVAAVIAAALGFGYLPLHRQRDAIRQRMAADAEFVKRKSEITALHAEWTARLRESEQHFEQLLTRVPNEPQESEFLAHLANLARSSGLSLDHFCPADPCRDGNFGEVEIRVSATGTYEQICRFLQGLNDTPRFCRVNSLKIAADDPRAEVYPLEIKLSLYFSAS